jgi:hypothetical protein
MTGYKMLVIRNGAYLDQRLSPGFIESLMKANYLICWGCQLYMQGLENIKRYRDHLHTVQNHL